MPMVFSGPKTDPNTVVNKLKKEPQPIPFTTAKKMSRPTLDANGQMASAEMPHRNMEIMNVLSAPSLVSATQPAPTRPTVDAKFQTVRATMATDPDDEMLRAKMGIKYGGTNSGKQPTLEAISRTMKRGSLNRNHCRAGSVALAPGGCLIRHAAGRQTAQRRKARMRNVHGTPTLSTSW